MVGDGEVDGVEVHDGEVHDVDAGSADSIVFEPDDEADERRPAERPGRGPKPPARVAPSLAGFEDPPTLRSLIRTWPWAPWLIAGLVILRFLAVAGLRLYLYFDSAEYDRVDFSGDWRRPWATPYLYWLIPGTNRAILVGQALIGAVCWAVLALSAAAWFRLPTMRWVVAATIAALGCTTIVTNWDAAKLSESLGLSLTVALIAAWLNFLRRTDWVTLMWVAIVTLPWLFVRQSLLSTAWLVVGLAAIGTVVVWRHDRSGARSRLLGVLCLLLVIETLVASVSYSHNQEIVQENLRVIVANRIVTDPARKEWFVDHGMPLPRSGAVTYEALKDDPTFTRWVEGDGRGTYVRFLATHPWYTATGPLEDFAGVRQSTAEEPKTSVAMLAPPDSYATSRPVLPGFVELVLFEPGGTGTAIAGLLLVTGWTLARRRRRSSRWIVPWLLIGLSFSSLYTGWHGATPELGRLALFGAVGLRLGILLQLAFLFEDELVVRRGDPELVDPRAVRRAALPPAEVVGTVTPTS